MNKFVPFIVILFVFVGGPGHGSGSHIEGTQIVRKDAPIKVELKPGDVRTEMFNGLVEMRCEAQQPEKDKYICSVACHCISEFGYDKFSTGFLPDLTGPTRQEAFKKVNCSESCSALFKKANESRRPNRQMKLESVYRIAVGTTGEDIAATPNNACSINR